MDAGGICKSKPDGDSRKSQEGPRVVHRHLVVVQGPNLNIVLESSEKEIRRAGMSSLDVSVIWR